MHALLFGLLLLCATETGGRPHHPEDRLLAVSRQTDFAGASSPCDVQLVLMQSKSETSVFAQRAVTGRNARWQVLFGAVEGTAYTATIRLLRPGGYDENAVLSESFALAR